MEYKIISLRQENARLMEKVTALEAENNEVKSENTKLRQEIEEYAVRFAKLEQRDKEKAEHIAKLNYDIEEIKKQAQIISIKQISPTETKQSNTHEAISLSKKNSFPVNPCERQCQNNSSISCDEKTVSRGNNKLSADTSGKTVSQGNDELSGVINGKTVFRGNDCEKISSTKTLPSGTDQQNTISVPCFDKCKSEEFDDSDEIELTKNQNIELDLIRDLQNSRPIVSPFDANGPQSSREPSKITTQSLIHLFQNAVRAGHEEIISWIRYSENFEKKVTEIRQRTRVTDKTARTQIYKEMLKHLPGITPVALRVKTLRAKKIRKLFGENGVRMDKIKYVTWSANEISKLTNTQIQNVIEQVTSKTVHSRNNQNLSDTSSETTKVNERTVEFNSFEKVCPTEANDTNALCEECERYGEKCYWCQLDEYGEKNRYPPMTLVNHKDQSTDTEENDSSNESEKTEESLRDHSSDEEMDGW